MKISSLIGSLLAVAVISVAAPAALDENEVAKIVERAKKNPEVLRELQGAPIELVFTPLRELWLGAEVSMKRRADARRRGPEAEKEFIEMEQSVKRDPDASERIYPIAKELLTTHPDLERYVTSRLQHLNEFQTAKVAGKHPPNTVVDVAQESAGLLGVAIRVPGDAAFRMVGPYLSAPDYPNLDQPDIRAKAAAKYAMSALRYLVKERLGVELPEEDVEAGRKWWAENKARFAVKAPAPAEGAPTTASSPQAPAQSPPTAPGTITMQNTRKSYYWGAAGVLALLIAGVWLYARSARASVNHKP